jgi:hypothetical protein
VKAISTPNIFFSLLNTYNIPRYARIEYHNLCAVIVVSWLTNFYKQFTSISLKRFCQTYYQKNYIDMEYKRIMDYFIMNKI